MVRVTRDPLILIFAGSGGLEHPAQRFHGHIAGAADAFHFLGCLDGAQRGQYASVLQICTAGYFSRTCPAYSSARMGAAFMLRRPKNRCRLPVKNSAVIDDLAALDDRIGGIDADDGFCRDGLTGAGLADDGQRFSFRSRLIPRTALTLPLFVRKDTRRSFTSNTLRITLNITRGSALDFLPPGE